MIALTVTVRYNPSRKAVDNMIPVAIPKIKDHRKKKWRAAIVALVMALVTGVLAAAAVAIWDKPLVWVPLLAGGAVGILTYALIAPES
jgi:hypothetical protein